MIEILYLECRTRLGDRAFLMYRGELKGLYVLLSKTLAGLGRAFKQEQEEKSGNHVQALY